MAVKDFDFSHYYTYQELVDYLSQMAEAYPKLIQLKVIGQSYVGRDIRLAILTNQKTGNYLEKPGYWIDANTHAGEVTGSAVACYIIYHRLCCMNNFWSLFSLKGEEFFFSIQLSGLAPPTLPSSTSITTP